MPRLRIHTDTTEPQTQAMSFHAKRRDANESTIIIALVQVGATVQQLNEKGVPDLLVGYQGRTFLIEVKNPEDTTGPKGGKRTQGRGCLRPAQVIWFAAWKGVPVVEVINADEALVAIGALRSIA